MSDSYTQLRATVPFDQEVDSMSDVPRGDSDRPRRRRRRRRHAELRDSGRGKRAGDEDLTPTEPGLERARELPGKLRVRRTSA